MASSIERMGLRNVTVLPSTLEELAGNDRRFDCVVLINVLEHIDDDQAALKITHELLRPEGYVGILVPAHSILYGALDAAYGHRRRYSRHDVESRLKNAGFRVRYARYFNPIGAIGWFLVGRVSGRGQLSRTSVALAERVAVPSGRMLERFGHLPFGQSIVAVGVKTERLGG
jgi:SAM-dependent methyltransferase